MNFINHEYKKLATKEDILALISDDEIFDYYLGGIPKKLISSPMREDKVPSFGLFKSAKYNKTFFKDFATGDSGDVFVFVKKLFNLSSLPETCNKIVSDFNLNEYHSGDNNYNIVIKRKPFIVPKVAEPSRIEIKVKTRKFALIDKEYWFDKYGINKSMLQHCKVYAISHYFLNDYCVKVKGLAYAFVENKDGKQTYKIYQPFEKDNKWINNNNYSVIELWNNLPKNGKQLIITSSRKDAMCIMAHIGIPSISYQSENTSIKESVLKELVSRFDNIFILYDNDYNSKVNAGQNAANKIINNFPLIKNLCINEKYNSKDFSDLVNNLGKEKAAEILIKEVMLINK